MLKTQLARQGEDLADRSAVHGYDAQRGSKTVGAGRGNPPEANPVSGAQQDHTVDMAGSLLQAYISTGSHRARVDVSGMRYDHGSW